MAHHGTYFPMTTLLMCVCVCVYVSTPTGKTVFFSYQAFYFIRYYCIPLLLLYIFSAKTKHVFIAKRL